MTRVHGRVIDDRTISGLHIHDPRGQPDPPRNALVLGVGVDDAQVVGILEQLGVCGAAALVVREPVEVGARLIRAVERSGVVLLGLAAGASWEQLAALLRTLLADVNDGGDSAASLGGLPSGDLFAVANAVAAIIDAPVTIEDSHSRVLAFSGRQDEADAARVATILGRQVPDANIRQLRQRGVFEQLRTTGTPVYVESLDLPSGEFSLPRVAVAVRAGDDFLGSMWAAVPGPFTEDRNTAFTETAALVALHLLRVRAGTDVQRQARSDLVAAALEGGPGGAEAIARLGLLGRRALVLALSVPDLPAHSGRSESNAASAAARVHLCDAFAMHLRALHHRSTVALVGEVVYALLPVAENQQDVAELAMQAVRTAQTFLDRTNTSTVIGIGSVAEEAAELPQSRRDAERALRVLLAGGEERRVATIDDVHFDALLLEFDELAAGRGPIPVGPLKRLHDYDAQHRTVLVDTLRHWLDALGNVPAAAAAAFVHPNTFRYRLRRLADVADLDLDDPDQRFAAMLQLRLLSLRRGGSPGWSSTLEQP